MKKAISILLALIFILASTASLAGCSKSPLDKIKSTKQELTAVGSAGGYEILYEEIRCLTLGFKERMEWTYGDDIWKTNESSEKYREQLEDYVLYALTVNAAALKVAADNGIKPDDKEVEEYVELKIAEQASELAQNLKIQNSDDNYSPSRKEINEAYEKFLAENHLTDNYYRYVLTIDACIEILKQKLVEKGTLSSNDDVITDYINENFVRTVHVYVPFENDGDYQIAKDKAELVHWILSNNFKFDSRQAELKEKLGINAYTDPDSSTVKFFNRIVDATDENEKMKVLIGSVYNKDMTISQNGYYFSYGEFEKSYEEAAMNTAINGISDPVLTETGFYIIQRLELDGNYIFTNLDTLKSQYHMAYINKLIDEAQANIKFEFNDYGKTLDLTKMQ